MSLRGRTFALAFALGSLVVLPRCTSFGTETVPGAEEPDAGGRIPQSDGQVQTDASPTVDAADASAADGATDSGDPTADYYAEGLPTELPGVPPYAFHDGTTPRFFALTPTGDTAAELPLTPPGVTWPIDRTTTTFAMLKVTSTNVDDGVRQNLLTVALSNGTEQFGRKNADGDGPRNDGTAVAVSGEYVYLARTDGGGTQLEILEQKVNPMSLRIAPSVKVYDKREDAPGQAFGVSQDRLSLFRIDTSNARRIKVYRRATTADTFPTPTTLTVSPPLEISDGILGFSGKSFYAYRRLPNAKYAMYKYRAR